MYYPEPGAPFSRVTLLSNYSPFIAGPDGATVLLTETSSSAFRPVDSSRVVRRVLDGLIWVGMLHQDDLSRVSGVWHHRPDKTYPVPMLGRNAALRAIHPWLRRGDIWSRGRFGAWCYEIGNMDHSVMQGVEWADHVIHGRPETVWQPP